MKIWLITMTERTDGRTDGRWTDARTKKSTNMADLPCRLAGWLTKTLVPEARDGGRTKNGRTDGRWTDARTPKSRNV